MTFPEPFHRLVIIGKLYDDIFNTTMSIIPLGLDPLPPVDDALLFDVASAVANWWPKVASSAEGGGMSISASAQLTSIKLNRIGTDGLYEDTEAKEYVLSPAIPGGGAAGLIPQLSIVTTFRGGDERGRAGKGRMFWPPVNGYNNALDATGHISESTATNIGLGAVTLIRAINAAYLDAELAALVGIASSVGTGRFQPVARVTVGRVVDTMRSRRNKDKELPVEIPYE